MEACNCCGEMVDEVILETCSLCRGRVCSKCRRLASLRHVYCDSCSGEAAEAGGD